MFSSKLAHLAGTQHGAAYQVSTPPSTYEGRDATIFAMQKEQLLLSRSRDNPWGHLIKPLAGYLNPQQSSSKGPCSLPLKPLSDRQGNHHPPTLHQGAGSQVWPMQDDVRTEGSSTKVCGWTHWVWVLALPRSSSVTLTTCLAQLCSASSL